MHESLQVHISLCFAISRIATMWGWSGIQCEVKFESYYSSKLLQLMMTNGDSSLTAYLCIILYALSFSCSTYDYYLRHKIKLYLYRNRKFWIKYYVCDLLQEKGPLGIVHWQYIHASYYMLSAFRVLHDDYYLRHKIKVDDIISVQKQEILD